MNKMVVRLILIGSLSGLAISVIADDNNVDYSSAYLSLGAGGGTIANLPTGSAAASVTGGYRFNRYLSLDAQWTGLPSSQWGWYDSYNLFTMNLGGILPVTDNWSFYAKAGSGVGYSAWSGTIGSPEIYNAPGSATSWVGQFTGGTSLAVSDHLNLYLENSTWVPFTSQPGSFATTNATFLGLQVNFSAPHSVANSSLGASASEQNSSQLAAKPAISITNNSINAPVAATAVITPAASAAPVAVTAGAAAGAATVAITSSAKVLSSGAGNQNVLIVTPMTTPAELKQRTQVTTTGRHYIVIRPGDTLYRIGLLSGIPEVRLKKLNRLSGNNVSLGSKFYLD